MEPVTMSLTRNEVTSSRASRRAFLVAGASALLLGAQPSRADTKQTGPEVGTVAPDFELSGRDGTVKLSDLRGKWVVLYFYPADFTSSCTLEARRFQEDLLKFRERNAEIIGVSADSVASHADFCVQNGLYFPLLADTDPAGEVSKKYGSWLDFKFAGGSLRHTFLIDPEGIIRDRFMNVNSNVHSKQVLARLDELLATA